MLLSLGIASAALSLAYALTFTAGKCDPILMYLSWHLACILYKIAYDAFEQHHHGLSTCRHAGSGNRALPGCPNFIMFSCRSHSFSSLLVTGSHSFQAW